MKLSSQTVGDVCRAGQCGPVHVCVRSVVLYKQVCVCELALDRRACNVQRATLTARSQRLDTTSHTYRHVVYLSLMKIVLDRIIKLIKRKYKNCSEI